MNLYNYLKYLLDQIPKGKVTTFTILSEALGSKYALKFILQNYKKLDKWYKIVNEKGIVNNFFQRELLKKEGVEFEGNRIKELDKYLFKDFKTEKPLEKLRKIQKDLVNKIKLEDGFKKIEIIGGVDLSYKNDYGIVVYVLLDKNLNLIKYYIFKEKIEFPYIPTFLAFREGEPVIKTFKKIEKPDILFVNGQGIAHPVKMGLATYVGVILNIPTIGVTKKHLFGKIIGNKIFINSEQVGWVIEKFGYKIYVSPGNLVSLITSKILTEKLWIKGRYPEPIRLADEISKKVKNKEKL